MYTEMLLEVRLVKSIRKIVEFIAQCHSCEVELQPRPSGPLLSIYIRVGVIIIRQRLSTRRYS